MTRNKEVILIASGKGGVGKSTVAANLGIALASKNLKTCIIDLDINLGKLDIIMGLEGYSENDIIDISKSNTPIDTALIQDPQNSNLYIMPAPRDNTNLNINTSILETIIYNLKQLSFDYIILDCPAGVDISNPFRKAAKLSSRALIITTQEKTSLRDADSIISILENFNYSTNNKLHLVVNKYYEPKILHKKGHIRAIDIERSLAVPVLSTIPFDKESISSTNLGTPSSRRTRKINNSYTELCNKLLKSNA